MFWTTLLILSLFAAGLIILVFVSMFLVHRWTANKLIERMTEKAVDAIPHKQIDFKV